MLIASIVVIMVALIKLRLLIKKMMDITTVCIYIAGSNYKLQKSKIKYMKQKG